jgi:hypothetical protein
MIGLGLGDAHAVQEVAELIAGPSPVNAPSKPRRRAARYG